MIRLCKVGSLKKTQTNKTPNQPKTNPKLKASPIAALKVNMKMQIRNNIIS